MAKKRTTKVPAAIADNRKVKPVRLDLSETDYDRLEKCADKKGLTKASFARMALLEKLEASEAGR